MKETLISKGWTCVACSCPGGKGVDCANKNFPGVLIRIRSVSKSQDQFRIVKKSLIVDTGFGYELEQKLISNNLN